MSLVSIIKKKIRTNLFTTPSHGGNFCILHKFYQWYKSDISEIDAIAPQVELKESEKKAALIYGTVSTHFLTNGSTSGIIAAILASVKKDEKILVWSKAHRCHKNGAKLASAQVIEYDLEFNEEWGLYEPINAADVEILIKKYLPAAIVITSPTYEGLVSDIKNISLVCKNNGVRLIVDEAHGALYPFSNKLPESAVKYADFTIQSLHKTAGGLNPTALLHCNCDLDIESTLNMINTTSPSYPMLASIEANIRYLNSQKGRKYIDNLVDKIQTIKSKIHNIQFYGDDMTKILIKKDNLSGFELSDILYTKYDIEDEITNNKSTMLLTGIGTTENMLKRLEIVLKRLDELT